MHWAGQTHALGTYVAQLGADLSTKIVKNETLPRQRRLMFGSEPAMYPTMDAIQLLLGPYARVHDTCTANAMNVTVSVRKAAYTHT